MQSDILNLFIYFESRNVFLEKKDEVILNFQYRYNLEELSNSPNQVLLGHRNRILRKKYTDHLSSQWRLE